MNIKTSATTFKSFEQFQATLFPKLIREKKEIFAKKDAEKFGCELADRAINKTLSKTKKHAL